MPQPAKTLHLRADAEGIAHAAALLGEGLAVAIPTETVYGLAADARRTDAVARIYAAKGRPSYNPLIVHVSGIDEAATYARLDAPARAVADAFWPGPLTLVLPLRDQAGKAGAGGAAAAVAGMGADTRLADRVTAGLGTVALRAPAHPVARAVLAAFGGPLAAPSANPSGRISPTEAAHVLDPATGLAGRIAAVLDAGPCAVGVESTILGWQADGTPVILRPGGITGAELAEVLGRPVGLASHAPAPDAPLSPGQLSSHYAPSVPLRLEAGGPRAGETYIGFGPSDGLTLSARGDLAEAAARLFSVLRQADAQGLPIAVAPIPREGVGLAINDRLARAAAPRPDPAADA